MGSESKPLRSLAEGAFLLSLLSKRLIETMQKQRATPGRHDFVSDYL